VHEPTSRASNLRTTALASAVALILALPLAFASAGPSGPAGPQSAVRALAEPHEPPGMPGTAAGAAEGAPAPAGPQARAGAFCGAELRSPEGVEAQTCVLTEGPDTWGRVYYRNLTGEPLLGALTVRQPDGRMLEVRCEVPASDEPGLCETPREPTMAEDGGRAPYSAVAELAAADGERLLRTGSTDLADLAD
jgi:hypothetical protein